MCLEFFIHRSGETSAFLQKKHLPCWSVSVNFHL
jgi:hypothetical protein